MLEIYFDGTLIDSDSYSVLTNDFKIFTDSFKLGSTASNSFKLSVAKSVVTIHPTDVLIDDGNTEFNLVVDSVQDDKNFYIYTLTDKLIDFDFKYDASRLIAEKKVLEETCYLSDIWHDMCTQAGVEYDETYIFLNDIEVTWYDNTIQARKYLYYISQLQSGYATILENGKQSFKPFYKASSKTINIDDCLGFILGEKKTISRVVYDNGVVFWEFGDTTGTTIYLDPTNVYVTTETIVENIYNAIVGLEFYLVDVPQCPIDSTIRAGDIITFTDGANNYPTIAQYSTFYNGGWVGGYKLQVKTDKQEETKITGTPDNILKLQTEMDLTNASLSIISQKTDGNSSNISILQTTVNGFNETIQQVNELESRTNTVETTIEGIQQTIQYSGGFNLLENCQKQFGQAGWEGNFENYTNTEVQHNSMSKSALLFMNDTEERTIQVPNGIYNFSAKYKKLIELAECSITINGHEILFTELDWEEEEYTFEVTSNTINIVFFSDTNDSLWLTDILFIPGDIKQTWTPNPNEVDTGTIQLGGSTLKIENDTTNTRFEAGPDGTRVFNKTTDEVVAEFTDKGTKTNEIEADNGQIAKVRFKDMGNGHTWIFRT